MGLFGKKKKEQAEQAKTMQAEKKQAQAGRRNAGRGESGEREGLHQRSRRNHCDKVAACRHLKTEMDLQAGRGTGERLDRFRRYGHTGVRK